MSKKPGLWAAIVAYFKITFSREKILAFFKTKFMENAVVALFKVAPTGFYGWIVNLFLTRLYSEVGEPLVKLGLRQVGYVYHKVEGKVLIKKLKKAQEDGDEDEYDDAVTDILS